MDSNVSKGDRVEKDHKLSQKPRLEYVLRALLFVFLFFLFIRKVVLVQKQDLKLERSFGAYQGHPHTSKIRGKPFNQNAYSSRLDFSSEESGTKIISHSKSLANLPNILDCDSETYMLAPCQTTDWFVLSFPESILIQEIAFISNEFYASTYKNIRVSVSDVYPTTKWQKLAEIETEPSKDEIFDISVLCDTEKNDCWGKYLKVELLDYHRQEENYYCSITKMMVYGVTAVEYLETEIVEDKAEDESVQKTAYTKIEMQKKEMGQQKLPADYNYCVPYDVSHERQFNTLSTLKCLANSRGNLNPTFMYDIKNTILSSLYKFLMVLALRPNRDPSNRKLINRIIRIGKSKKYCGTNIMFQFNCNRFITYLLLDKYSKYYANILDFVQLPSNHLWFESILFDFTKNKKHLVYNIINDVGINEVPVLVCLESMGLIPRYKCYFYFNLKSFSTLLFTQFSKGFKQPEFEEKLKHQKSKRETPLLNLYDKFHFYYADNRIVLKKSTAKTKSVAKRGDHFVRRYDYKIRDEYISSITVVDDQLYINLSPDSPTSSPFDLYHMGKKTESDMVKMGTGLYKVDFLTNITKYLDSRNRYYNIKSSFTKKKVELHTNEELGEQPDMGRKDPKTHKHVLLKLSERIKSLEYLTNKLSNKIYEIEKLLNLSINQLYKQNQGNLKYSLHTELDYALSSLGVFKFKVISKKGVKPKKNDNYHSVWYYKRVNKHRDYEEGHLYVRSENMESFRTCFCKLSYCQPVNESCRRLHLLSNLSYSFRVLNKTNLIKCMLNHGCKCTLKPHEPHNGKTPGEQWVYLADFKVNVWYYWMVELVLKVLKTTLPRYLNIYSLFFLFLITQIFWVCKYNNHSKKLKRLYLSKKP